MKNNFRKFINFKILIIGVIFCISVFVFTFLFFNKQEISKVTGTLFKDSKERIHFNNNGTENKREDIELIRTILKVSGSSYEVYVPKESSVYEMMKIVASQNSNFSFKGKEFPGLGFFVEEINGTSQNKKDGKYWIYYINGKPALVGVSQYKLKENDIITWKYEKEY